MGDILYNWSQGGGFIIRFCQKTNFYKLYEVPLFGGDEQHVGNFDSVEDAKEYADKLS